MGHMGHLIRQEGSRQKQEGLNSHSIFHHRLIWAAKNDLFKNVWSMFSAREMLVFIMSLWKLLTELAGSNLLIPQDSGKKKKKKSHTQSMLFLNWHSTVLICSGYECQLAPMLQLLAVWIVIICTNLIKMSMKCVQTKLLIIVNKMQNVCNRVTKHW